MKKSIRTIALISAAVMSLSVIPAASCYSADNTSAVSSSQSTSQSVKYGKVTSISGTKVKLALGEYSQPTAPGNAPNGQMPPPPPDGNGQNGTPPAMPENDGNPPSMPGQGGSENGEPPAKPDGEAPDAKSAPGGEFTENGKTLT